MSCTHNENKQTIPNKVDGWTANGGLADQLIAGEGLLHINFFWGLSSLRFIFNCQPISALSHCIKRNYILIETRRLHLQIQIEIKQLYTQTLTRHLKMAKNKIIIDTDPVSHLSIDHKINQWADGMQILGYRWYSCYAARFCSVSGRGWGGAYFVDIWQYWSAEVCIYIAPDRSRFPRPRGWVSRFAQHTCILIHNIRSN